MAFSARPVKPQRGSPAFVSARTGTLSRSTTGTAPGPPKTKLTKALTSSLKGEPGAPGPGQAWSHATPGHDGPGAAAEERQPRDRAANWHYNKSPDRRRSEAVQVQVGAGSPGIKRLQTGDEDSARPSRGRATIEASRQSQVARQQTLQVQASRQEALQLGSPAKEISGKPTFQDAQRSPGLESVSTNTGGGCGGSPWSPGRSAYRLKRYTVGGATQIFKDEDLPQEDDPLAATYGQQAIDARTNPKAWTHSEKLRNWEKRLHGDAKLEARDEQLRDHREQQRAHDASLTEAFGRGLRPAPGSPRAAGAREAAGGGGIAGHPSQRGMRAAFTDRALKLAHMSEHFSLAHAEDPQGHQASSAPGSPASFDMPAAGNGSLSKGPKSVLATMHMDSGDAATPGNTARAAKSAHSDRMGYLLKQAPASKEPERDEAQVKSDEGFFRHQMGNRHPGDMAPTTRDMTKARARSAESFAGASRPWGSKLDVFKAAAPGEGGERHALRRHVQDWLPSDRVTMAQCLTSARDDATAEPVDIVFMQGHSPPCTKFSSTADQKKQGGPQKEGGKGGKSGRPDYWFDRTGAYSTGRRRGRGEGYEHSAESTKQSITRDAESAVMYRYELIAAGEATPRACSQPPVYNPLTHEGELYPGSARSRGKAMTPRSARQSGTQSAGRLLDYQAGKMEDEELRTNRMKNDEAFSNICQFAARENEKRSQEFAQSFRQRHHQKSSNMALLLSWE